MMFNKRIGFLISSQHLIPHGGIGQFAKGFAEMCQRLGYMVDIIMDQSPTKNSLVTHLESLPNVSFVHEPGEWQGLRHQKIHAFSESINYERVMKFRDSLMRAMQTRLYDTFIINTPEALFSTYALGIQEHVQTVFYTHNENLVFPNNAFKGVFNDIYDPMILNMCKVPGLYIGTQTQLNATEMYTAHKILASFLPMPIPERSLLESSSRVEKSGVLFIGRWEDRKNPKEFIKLIADTKLPAKVMTNSNGASKFKAALDDIGATYEIRESIVGQEKVDFVKSAKVFFMPSKSESYGFALMEAIGHTNAVVLSDYEWHKNFDGRHINVCSKKQAADTVLRLYNEDISDAKLEYIKSVDADCDARWQTFIESFVCKQSTSSAATICKSSSTFVKDFIDGLGRFASIEDLISIYGNKHRFSVHHTIDGTWLSVNGEMPKEKKTNDIVTLDDFF